LCNLLICSTYAHTVMGVVQGAKEIVIKTKSQGELKKVFFKEGSRVSKGDVIAQIDNTKELIQKKMAKSDYKLAKSDYKKSKKLKEYISKEELAKKEGIYKKRKGQYELSKLNVENKSIISPIDGVVTKSYIKVGENIGSGQQAYEVILFDELTIDLYVQAKYAKELKLGIDLPFVNELDSQAKFLGKISYISPAIDKTSGTIKIKLKLQNVKNDSGTYLLKPGVMVKVSI
jgi:membrane fusion protein (multidrug efflux system)